MKKFLIFSLFFFFLTLLQTSFFIHFPVFGFYLNFIIIGQVLITLFEDPKENRAIYLSFISGFLWDVFSEKPIGFGILILFLISWILKIFLRKYVRIEAFSKF